MVIAADNEALRYWRVPLVGWIVLIALSICAAVIYYDGIARMVNWWMNREEYSHGFLIPVITAYLIHQRSDRLRETRFTGSWIGVGLALIGLFLYFLGELSTIYAVIQYGFVIFLCGAIWAFVGTRAFRIMAIPLLLLFFMVPFPNFIYNTLSQKLQLLSSEIGVAVIRLFGISVYLEGNVIDLGSYKLQVVEACDGLRYLFPLMTLGVIVAYFYQAAMWKRLLIFFSTIPITILMNSFRIGVIGIMVEYWGQSMAEGFLHDFEGWAIFMACFAILFLEMWLLMRLSRDKRPLRATFGIDPPERPDSAVPWQPQRISPAFISVLMITILALAPAAIIPSRVEVIPERQSFAAFPLDVGHWSGRSDSLDQIFLDALKLTDYLLINFVNPGGNVVNFYSAYYESQKKGQSAHSPKSCLPGGGWLIESFGQRRIGGVDVDGTALFVNRVVIGAGSSRQLVYYWFQQRGRVVTNEYLVKWFIFWDALTRNRTDGALLRLVATLQPGQDIDDLDEILSEFVIGINGILPAYIPG